MPVEQLGIQWIHRIGIFTLGIVLVATVLELVRRGLLKERYALLWMTTAAASFVVGLFPGIIEGLAGLFHFQYLTVLFSMYFAFTLALVLAFSVVISQLAEHNRALAQEVALLAHTVDQLEKRLGP
jgi:hypothetical protein